MKRFVTYLYECERGNKSKNVGFIRINVRGSDTTMEVYIRNFLRNSDAGKIYALIYKKDLCGIELGEIKIINGQSDSCITFPTGDMMESGCSLNDIVGIGIRLESGAYIVSCWKDNYAEEMVRGEFQVNQNQGEAEVEENLAVAEKPQIQERIEYSEPMQVSYRDNSETSHYDRVSYEKIDLSQIRDLPSPNWYLTTNSFLVHGFWNYGYLVLKKEMEEGEERLALGVPGVFEKPEVVMAALFGFPAFAEIPQEMVKAAMNQSNVFSKKEKNQEPKVGTFGCWFVDLKI